MKIITKNKTTELVKMAHNECKLIVCQSKHEAHRIKDYGQEQGYDIYLPITYEEFINKRYSNRNTKSLLIDNVDMLVAHIANVSVEAITLSIDDK